MHQSLAVCDIEDLSSQAVKGKEENYVNCTKIICIVYAHVSQWDIHLCANFLLLVQENITPPRWLTKLNLESDSGLSSSATLKSYLEVLLNMIFELHMTISSTKYFAFQLIKAKLAYFTLRRDFLACVQKN